MQTVHIWPVDHLLLENNLDARKARKAGALEVLVVIFNGKIVEIVPPADGEGEFRGQQDLVGILSRTYHRGLAGGRESLLVAPEGWILWRDLQLGMLAYDGHDQHVLRFAAPFEHTEYHGSITSGFGIDFNKARQQTTTVLSRDLVWLGSEKTTESVQTYDSEKRTQDPYLKVVRKGLTQAQCLEIRAMCQDGNYAAFRPSYVL